MAYQDNGGRPQRAMNDVSAMNITCAECGTKISELPFMPSVKEDGTYGKIYCFDCNKKRPRREFRPRGGNFGDRGGYRNAA